MYLRKRKSIKIINTLLVIALLSVVLTVSVYAADVSVSYSGSNDISMSSILHYISHSGKSNRLCFYGSVAYRFNAFFVSETVGEIT